MWQTLRDALRIKDIRSRLLFTFGILVLIRIGCQIPTPGVSTTYIAQWLASRTGDSFNFFDAMTGGSLTSMSIFALNISPYITSSIIMQLLTIAFPALEEMAKDGEEGRKKMNKITRYVTLALALIESSAIAIGFGRQGLIPDITFWKAAVVVICLSAGAVVLMWLGEQITEKGIGNGISMVLLINILSSVPTMAGALIERFVTNASNVATAVVAVIVILVVVAALVAFVVFLNDGERRVPVQYSSKMMGRRSYGGNSSNLNIKVNTANVIPVIFASSLMSIPSLIAQFFTVDYTKWYGKILTLLSTQSWFRREAPWYTLGVLIYIALIILFAYFYTSVTFNPVEIAGNLKKSGGFVPGIRPGKPTSDYLKNILNYLILIGAVGLCIVVLIPIIVTGIFSLSSLSLGGTSIIIICGVILETLQQLSGMLKPRNYEGFSFLN
ncbi:MAG: preprotein translocase subunit SecY [Lachnospiraceae bacterium]|nr:preprotein translocase subunit SecY [Lachnospiraceae bacterium]